MINKLVELAERLSVERKQDPDFLARMETATLGQAPRFLLISPINRSSQDLLLFGLKMGDAFHSTRVPRMPLLSPKRSPILFAAPAAYNREFPDKRGVILTFEQDDSDDIIHQSIASIREHPDLDGIPILAFRVNYDTGSVRIFVHGKGRSYEAENWLLSRVKRPEYVDFNTLIIICSDSRVRPPSTPHGVPLGIQTLAGYIPKYTGEDDETQQLNSFFKDWLDAKNKDQRIILIAHGNFEGDGPSCGAGKDSLNPYLIKNDFLKSAVIELQEAASAYEDSPAENPEARVISLSSATRDNLGTYPAIRALIDSKASDFISILLMDTVSNALSSLESD